MTDRVAPPAARYWDEHREKSLDPEYWMAHPLCRRAINRRVSGSPDEWPLDWFRRVHVVDPFRRGVSWGCGLGAFERAALGAGIVGRIDAFDVSEASLADARREQERDGLAGITYSYGNFNEPVLERRCYDVVFFHQSLHHVHALERLFRRLSVALAPGGAVYVDEYVGPSRFDWTPERLGRAQAALDMAPEHARLRAEIDIPVQQDDPSEAIRSSEIQAFLQEFFDVVAWRPYGGQIADLVFPCLAAAWVRSDAGMAYVDAVLRMEDFELARDPGATHYLVAFGRLKARPRLASRLARRVRAVARRGQRPLLRSTWRF